MFIESAFYKMPELLINERAKELYEDSVRNMLSLSFLLEFNSRNIPSPIERIKLEKVYNNTNRNWKCDLFLDLEFLYDKLKYENFGFKDKNWFEIKYFGGEGRSAGSEPKTANVGRILNDILRLCLCISELKGGIRENGRYFICIFNNSLDKYLPQTDRYVWLKEMFNMGIQEIDIDFFNIKKTSKEIIDFKLPEDKFKLYLEIETKSFYPIVKNKFSNFYGFLIKIFGFEIQSQGLEIVYNDFMKEPWDDDKIDSMNVLSELLDF